MWRGFILYILYINRSWDAYLHFYNVFLLDCTILTLNKYVIFKEFLAFKKIKLKMFPRMFELGQRSLNGHGMGLRGIIIGIKYSLM